MLSWRIEICSWELKLQWQRLANDERQITRVELMIFTRFAFKIVFRVSGRSVPWDRPLTSKGTGAHNLYAMLSVKAYCSVNKWYINIS